MDKSNGGERAQELQEQEEAIAGRLPKLTDKTRA